MPTTNKVHIRMVYRFTSFQWNLKESGWKLHLCGFELEWFPFLTVHTCMCHVSTRLSHARAYMHVLTRSSLACSTYLSAELMVTWWCEVLLQARCGTILTDLDLALVKQFHARVSIINYRIFPSITRTLCILLTQYFPVLTNLLYRYRPPYVYCAPESSVVTRKLGRAVVPTLFSVGIP
jgi:hypothetical protein